MKLSYLLIIALGSFNLALATAEVSIPMETLKNNSAFVVDVSFGQFGSTKMLVDTGASDSVLLDWFVKKNNIPVDGIVGKGVDSGGNSFELKKAKVDSFSLMEKSYSAESLFIVPTPAGLQEMGIGGILSPQTVFKGHSFLLDFPNKRISLDPLDIEGSKKPTEILPVTYCSVKRNKYVIAAKLNEVAGNFYLDTGGKSAAITKDFAAKLGNLKGSASQRIGVSSTRSVVSYKDVTLNLNQIEEKIPVEVEEKGVACAAADGKLGIDFLQNYSLKFNKERTEISLRQMILQPTPNKLNK